MKKIYFYLIIISATLLSCKKEKHSTGDTSGKLYPIAFNVTGFTQINVPENLKTNIKVNSTPTEAGITKLYYKVYDSGNILKKTKIINKDNPAFGPVRDSLAAGSYTAVFVGIKDTVNFIATATAFKPGSVSDIFYKKISFTVDASGSQQDVVLQRLNAEIQVIIKDAIPAGTAYISMSITDYSYFSFFDDKPTSGVFPNLYPSISVGVTSPRIPADKIGTTNYSLPVLNNVLNTLDPVSVGITSGSYYKLVPNIQLHRNTRTILTGNLFTSTGAAGGGFTVTYEPYNPDIKQSF